MFWAIMSRKIVKTIMRPSFRRMHMWMMDTFTASSAPVTRAPVGPPGPAPCSTPRWLPGPGPSCAPSSSSFCLKFLLRSLLALVESCVITKEDGAPLLPKCFVKIVCITLRLEELFMLDPVSTFADGSELSSNTAWKITVKGNCASTTATRIARGESSSVMRTITCLSKPGTSQISPYTPAGAREHLSCNQIVTSEGAMPAASPAPSAGVSKGRPFAALATTWAEWW
mmetsp:Transcript_58952/g.126706  ORF Transcript_58952/g.126706 Transcript_58952/m.126706 type:complete len:227 (-) Transcript_58952:985-1665(-)